MKITDVRNYLTTDGGGTAVYTAIETDAGITGYGDATLAFYPQAVYGMLGDLRQFLIGEDPLRIPFLWQMCWRRLFVRGGPISGAALAGIDMALWDIKGKLMQKPVYELLGGLARERVRLYGHAAGMNEAEIAAQAAERVSRGITAIRYRGFHDTDSRGHHAHHEAVEQQVSYLRAIREAVGPDTNIILECHGRYDLEWAVRLAERAKPHDPYYIEDPIRHENPIVLAQLRQKTSIPIACGERYHSKWDFREVIVGNLVDYVRPDVCWCGGISEAVKIAAMAETYYINVILHNNAGPLGSAAALHVALAVPNLTLLEAPFVNSPAPNRKDAISSPFPEVVDGYALPPDNPGLGVTVDEERAAKAEYVPRSQPRLVDYDGSVRDW
jgi:galactonate dehydratase